MKVLPDIDPDIYDFFVKGGFVGRRSYGSHNAVSPAMLLEQTYNADTKEEEEPCSIYTNTAARTKWVFIKCVTAATS